jgi:hypothetical protein
MRVKTPLGSLRAGAGVPTMTGEAPDSRARVRNDVDDDTAGSGSADPGWSWPPYAPWEPGESERFDSDEWAPASSVRRPWVRVGRWTLLYRRAA